MGGGRSRAPEHGSHGSSAIARGQHSTGYRGGSDADDRLALDLGAIARSLQDAHSVDDTLDAIVNAAVVLIPGAEHASISVVRRRRQVETMASTGPLPRAADQVQYETGQGPCIDSLHRHVTVRLDDLSVDERWPEFARGVRELRLASVLAVQLYVEAENLGALNLFSGEPHAFTDESEHTALLFAAHAAVAMTGAQREQRLRTAITSRDLIGQAMGMLMERHDIASEQAFAVLARYSQDSNRKLNEVAGEVVRSGAVKPHGAPAGQGALGEGPQP